MKPEIIWLASGIVLMAMEIIVPGFVIIWFGAGAIVTALFVFTGIVSGPVASWAVFLLSSFALLLTWNFLLKRKFGSKVTQDQRDATLVSLRGVAVTEIFPHKPGDVELFQPYHGIKVWKAESGESIVPGDEVEVIEARGIHLVVKITGENKKEEK